MESIKKLLEIMVRLRDPADGCAWDRQQNFGSIAPYTIEEAYEVADAIDREDIEALRDELGDLLFQVVFHSRLAQEQGAFDFNDVARGIADKLERRHPHVFGSPDEKAKGQQKGSWESIKAGERAAKRATAGPASALDGVALSLPALKRAAKLGERAAISGFDWPDSHGAKAKIAEELDELVEAEACNNADFVEDELGDLLFAVVNLSRHLQVDPEAALTRANRKFERRFRLMEQTLLAAGQPLESLSLDELETAWQRAKADLDNLL